MRQVDPLATTCWVLTQRIGNFDAFWQGKVGFKNLSFFRGLPREMSMSDRHRNTMELLNNVVSRNLRSSDRWTYRTLVVTLSSISKKWKITDLFVPFSGFFLIWNLGFLPRHSDGESPRVEPKSPSDHLEVKHGMCFYDVLDASTERCFKPALAGCNDRGTWCLIQFTSIHVQMAVTRPLSCGVIWNSCSFKMWLRCVILLLFHYISLDFTSVRPFSRFFLATGQDDFPGRKMKDPRLGASNWSHHVIDIVQTCWTTNQTKVWMKTLFFLLSLCSLHSLSIISKAKVRSHSGIDSNFRTWTWHNMRWVRLPTTCWFLRNSVNVSIDIRTFPLITPDYTCTTHYTKR